MNGSRIEILASLHSRLDRLSMPTFHLLGTGAAISDPHRTTTMLAVSDDPSSPRTLVVDCGGDVLQRLLACGLPIDSVEGLVVTHAHMDHTSGFPLLMEKVWLDGRERPLPVVGIEPALAQAERLWAAYEPVHSGWDGLPPIDWREVPHERDALVWDEAPWTITAAPVNHGDTPNVGLRVEHAPSGRVLAYSCDTAPTESVVHLAENADVLVHEANGTPGDNHSTAAGAAEVARDANADRLLLVHLPPGDKSDALKEARAIFPHTDLGEELGTYSL
jgi:ribonuclease Z